MEFNHRPATMWIIFASFLLIISFNASSAPNRELSWVDCNPTMIGLNELNTIDGKLTVDDSNINETVYFIKNSYVNFLDELFKAHRKYKDMPKKGFILWRNNEFQPRVSDYRSVYTEILENNRQYIYQKGGFDLVNTFNSMTDITLISLKMMESIRDGAKTKKLEAGELIKDANSNFKRVFHALSLCSKPQ